MNPILSIIIPCYNHGKYIEETLQSIEKAKDKYPIEIIIVNDGSTDNFTIEILKKIEQHGYFVLNQKNGGLGNARNNGIKLAKGKYILPLDSDNNVLYPYLNDAIDILENDEKIDIIYGDALYIGEKNGVCKIGEYNLQKLMIENYIDACAIFKKTIWGKIGGYDEHMPHMGWEDWDFWLSNSFKNHKFKYFNKECFEYRVLKGSMIRINSNFNEIVKNYIEKKYPEFINYNFIYNYISYDIAAKPKKFHQFISINSIITILKYKFFYHFKKYFK